MVRANETNDNASATGGARLRATGDDATQARGATLRATNANATQARGARLRAALRATGGSATDDAANASATDDVDVMRSSGATMSTGEVSSYLSVALGDGSGAAGFSRQTVRRLIDRGELVASWSRDFARADVHGRPMRGHRRVSSASVVAFVERVRGRAVRDANEES